MSPALQTGTLLDRIVGQKRFRLDQRMSQLPGTEIRQLAESLQTKPVDFALALRRPKSLGLIAEIKQASPSKGLIAPDFRPVEQALAYSNANVQAISVLTEEDFFLGSDDDFRAVRSSVSLPLLRKDFTIEPYQIYEARLLGASAVLLIVALLDNNQLREFMALCSQLSLQALVEVHTLEELMRALDCGAQLIGINNRDLHTFHVDLAVTERLAGVIPNDRLVVSESGISNAHDMARVYRAGAHAVLVGETLMRQAGSLSTVGDAVVQLYSEMPG